MIGCMFAGTECVVESFRGRTDHGASVYNNSVIAGFLVGGALGFRGKCVYARAQARACVCAYVLPLHKALVRDHAISRSESLGVGAIVPRFFLMPASCSRTHHLVHTVCVQLGLRRR